MKLFTDRRPSAGTLVAVVALTFALGGTAIAADPVERALTKAKVKKIARKQADKRLRANVLGSHVNLADKATTATSATSATSATNATNATNAANADKLDGREFLTFVQTTTAGNISGDCTYPDHPLLNGNPSAVLVVTHQFKNAGRHDFVLGTFYDSGLQRWCIYNESGAAMPVGETFNVIASNLGGLAASSGAGSGQGANAPGS